MKTLTAREWKALYARERAELGRDGLRALVAAAPVVSLPSRGALVFPHVHLRDGGRFVAAVARAVVQSGRDRVLALGVLHGGREQDRALVSEARARSGPARERLRRVHGPGVPGDLGHWTDEFSLDGFGAMLGAAAEVVGRPAPVLVERYPFLVGTSPRDLPGIEELRALIDEGVAVVATADPVHHGIGYEAPPEDCVPLDRAVPYARARIEEGFDFLRAGDLAGFLEHAARVKSDFRDPGCALVGLFGQPGISVHVHDVGVADYSFTLECGAPTWVASALASIGS